MMDEREDIAVPPQVVQEAYDHAVVAIKQAIIRQQGRAARQVNQVQLALYFGIGKYVSDNSRSGYWNSGAIDYISRKLKSEMPGLRGFSPTNIKMMRLFYAAALCLTEKSYFCFQRADREFYSMSGHWVSTIFSRVSVA